MNVRLGRQRLLLVAAGCVLLLAADRFVFTPLISGWKARSERIEELAQSIEKGAVLLDRRDTLEERWKSLRDQSLPADAPTAENQVLSYVTAWASSAGLSVVALKPRWVDDDETGPRMEIRISGTGSLEAVSRFLFALESGAIPLRIEDIELRARDDAGRDIALEARVSGLTVAGKEDRS